MREALRKTDREYSLDILKVIATVLIVFHHYQQAFKIHFDSGINFYQGSFYIGYVVELFFILSGYFTFPYIDKLTREGTFSKFFLKKWIRVFPLLLLSTIAYETILLIAPSYGDGYNLSFWGTVITALGIQEGWVFDNPHINNPLWYVSVLLLCYCVFYIITYISKRAKIPLTFLIIFVMLIGIGTFNAGIDVPFFNTSSARGYYAFFFGILLAKLINGKEFNTFFSLACFGIMFSIVLLIIYNPTFIENDLNYTMTFIFYPALIIFVKSKKINKILNRPIFETLGKISFDVYIWHSVMLLLLSVNNDYLIINFNNYHTMIIITTLCFAIGAISYFALEKPIDNRIRYLLKKRCMI